MLVLKKIPFELFVNKKDVFLLKRSFDLNGIPPMNFRGLTYENHLTGTLETLYPFIGCLVITKILTFGKIAIIFTIN